MSYSKFDFYLDIEGISADEIKNIVSKTFGKWIAKDLMVEEHTTCVSIFGVIDSVKWHAFFEDMLKFQDAILGAGGTFSGRYKIF